MKNILAYIKTIDLRCGNCIYFKSSKCPFPDAEPYHKPCADGLLVAFFDRDVLIKQGKNTLLKPIRFLTSSKTKLEMMKTFDLDKNEVEEAILQIKLMFAERKKKKPKPEPKPKIETQTQEDIELEEKALKLLKEPNLLDKFLEYQNKWLVMDETTRKIELLTCVSAYGDYPLNLALQQVFSAGKTTTIVQTAKFFQDVWYLGGLSPKALIHQQGEYEEESKAYIINLEKKILIFMDEPAFETLQMLKPLLSHDKRRIEYRFVDKESGKTETIIILCDLARLLFGGDTRQNIPIRHRDVIFVPRRRDTLLEEIHDSLGYWASMMTDVQQIRDIIKAMEKW